MRAHAPDRVVTRYGELLTARALDRLATDLADLAGAYRSGLIGVDALVTLQRTAVERAALDIVNAETVVGLIGADYGTP